VPLSAKHKDDGFRRKVLRSHSKEVNDCEITGAGRAFQSRRCHRDTPQKRFLMATDDGIKDGSFGEFDAFRSPLRKRRSFLARDREGIPQGSRRGFGGLYGLEASSALAPPLG